MPALKLTAGVAHGVLQPDGLLTVKLLLHVPLLAVIVRLVPMEMPVTVLPLTVPLLTLMDEPEVALKATEYVPNPVQTPLPALNTGVVQPDGGVIQLAGELTFEMVVAQPLALVAVRVTSTPTVMPVTLLPITVPLLAVTMPLLLKLTS